MHSRPHVEKIAQIDVLPVLVLEYRQRRLVVGCNALLLKWLSTSFCSEVERLAGREAIDRLGQGLALPGRQVLDHSADPGGVLDKNVIDHALALRGQRNNQFAPVRRVGFALDQRGALQTIEQPGDRSRGNRQSGRQFQRGELASRVFRVSMMTKRPSDRL